MTLSTTPPGDQDSEPKIVVCQHLSPEEFLAAAYPTLRRDEREANIVLAHALARVEAGYALTECGFARTEDLPTPIATFPVAAEEFWLTVWSKSGSDLDGVVSCIGDYPIFLWRRKGATIPATKLAAFLCACVIDPKRVFALFGPTQLVDSLARAWTALTGFATRPEPLYDALFASCEPQNWQSLQIDGNRVRKGRSGDLNAVAGLCEEFAGTSEYPLNASAADAEARELLAHGLVWVYETTDQEIASICAITRTSLRVAAITKVYTRFGWRRRGFAQDLVGEVTRRLFECGKGSVVLYVGRDNVARRVYERVGFEAIEGEGWKEIGFEGTTRGHW
ncbi:N-acetyltransferase domain-containing protein [Mycena kentingensis (nom. inval.)]|nr:N-acetyltransferase domain-containing protein [Mycena kentingensis (nom. inval.)]